VAPHQIGFLGPSEEIEPVMLFFDRNHIQKFSCSYLNPAQNLHAYGAIALDIVSIPGAPSARVAACLVDWGLPLGIGALAREIQENLEKHQTLVIIQDSGKHPDLEKHVREHLPDSYLITSL
jgi:hypothetical protein